MGTSSLIEVRDANVADVGRISVLLTALAEEFIVGEFSAEGRRHLLTHFGVAEMEERLKAAEYRFRVAAGSKRCAVSADGIGRSVRHAR